MTTALTLLNRVLAFENMNAATSATYTTLTGWRLQLLNEMQRAQRLIMLDFKGFEFDSLITEASYSVVSTDTHIDAPVDLNSTNYKYAYVVDSSGDNIGRIDIIKESDYKKFGSRATQGRICFYLSGAATQLNFTEDATTTHTVKVVYVKAPTDLEHYDHVCDIPAAYDDLIYYKTISLALIAKDQTNKAANYEGYYQKLKAQVMADKKRTASKFFDKSLDSYWFSGTW